MLQPFTSTESFAAPLAEHFFIAGIETSCLVDRKDVNAKRTSRAEPSSSPVRKVGESFEVGETGLRPISRGGKSFDKRQSIGSVMGMEQWAPQDSKRNSTILDRINPLNVASMSEEDFDAALKRFAAERDTVLEEIEKQPVQDDRLRVRSPSHRLSSTLSTHRRDKSLGSLRRRLSGINPLTRSSTSSRRMSNRFSKRMSNYNSVIPSPRNLQQDPQVHPLKRAYEPVLLDQYPRKEMVEECRGRKAFPDYVPMFVFPSDVNVVAADERPKCKYHGWTMTAGDGSRLYGMCIIVYVPLRSDAADILETEMEEWRNNNMSGEDREMAKDLGERLAAQRAKLSELLAQLPQYAYDSDEREALEEDISTVEERITLMADVLKPVRLGAASKIDGLTNGESGFWIPRAYGVLGRDQNLMPLWKEWLRVVTIPMTNCSVLRVPASSPRIGIWQPLEQYVVNLLFEAPSPHSSITQVELAIRDVRLYARKEAQNEIPGSRSTDLWPLFRCMDVPDIVVLFEYVLSESRIVLISSHTSLLYLVSAAITQLLYPLKWAGIFIPVLPLRLIEALEAPCPYICGIERGQGPLRLPQDDSVVVDLDQGTIVATTAPTSLPRQVRRKLIAILQQAAPHRYRYGVESGPPAYVKDVYPFDTLCSENASIFDSRPDPSHLFRLANLGSAGFGKDAATPTQSPPLYNAALPTQNSDSVSSGRPSFATPSSRAYSPPPDSACFEPPTPRLSTVQTLQASLRGKRSGANEQYNRRNSTMSILPMMNSRSANVPEKPMFTPPAFRRSRTSHAASPSISTIGPESNFGDFGGSQYAPSVYAQSTVASTIMPNMISQRVMNTETRIWSEGHCLDLDDMPGTCSICNDTAEEGLFKCDGCSTTVHSSCAEQICLVCPVAFHPEQISAAFVRCFASLFYTYRRAMLPTTPAQKSTGQVSQFNMEVFLGSVPHEHAAYLTLLRETQAFNEFISEREYKATNDPAIRLFDEVIMAKRNRGRTSFFSKQSTSFLADTSDHIWRTAAAPSSSSRTPSAQVLGRTPAKLDRGLMRQPRALQGAPQLNKTKPKRKQIASMMGLGIRSKTEPIDLAVRDEHDKENTVPEV